MRSPGKEKTCGHRAGQEKAFPASIPPHVALFLPAPAREAPQQGCQQLPVARAYTVEAWARRPPRKGRASPSRVRRVLDKPFDSASKRGGLVEASPCLRCCQLQLARKTHPHCQTRRSSASTTFSSDSRYLSVSEPRLGTHLLAFLGIVGALKSR